jgi:hypothetical protein
VGAGETEDGSTERVEGAAGMLPSSGRWECRHGTAGPLPWCEVVNEPVHGREGAVSRTNPFVHSKCVSFIDVERVAGHADNRAMTDESGASLEVRYADRRALLSSAKTERGTLTLFVPTKYAVIQGARLLLKISFGDADERFELQGIAVTGGRAIGRDGVGGFLASFAGDHKRRAAEMVAFCAQRPRSMGTASRERLVIRKSCQLKVANRQVPGELRDLSQTGAFIVGSQLGKIKEGEPVWLKVEGGLFGLGGIWIEARVIWQGKKGEERGLGLRFTGNEARQAAAIQRLLDRAVAGR